MAPLSVEVWAGDEVPISIEESSDGNTGIVQDIPATVHDVDDIYDALEFGVYSVWFVSGCALGFQMIRMLL